MQPQSLERQRRKMAEKFAHVKSRYTPFFSQANWTKKEQTPPRCYNVDDWLSYRKRPAPDDTESQGLSSCATLTHHYYNRMVRTIPRKKNFKEMDMDAGAYRKLIEKGTIVAFSNTREGEKKAILESDDGRQPQLQIFNSETTINLPIH